MDILLSKFVNKYINEFNEEYLEELNKFLNFDDEVIFNFYQISGKLDYDFSYEKVASSFKIHQRFSRFQTQVFLFLFR